MHALAAMFVHRPYVIAFLAAFALLAWSERGILRATVWLLSGTLLGWASEFCSVLTGFPFGGYVYHKEQFAAELWLGPVPLFASISFGFLSYFAYSAARQLLAGWTADGAGLDGAPRTMLLAAVIGTWMDTVMDPMTLVGRYWFLGDLYHYDPPGSHFGVPLSNYVGWLLTIGVIVWVNQGLDRLLDRIGVARSRGPALPFERLWGIGCCAGVFGFMLVINVMLIAGGRLPSTVPLIPILVSGITSSGLFVAFVVFMLRHRQSAVHGASRRAVQA